MGTTAIVGFQGGSNFTIFENKIKKILKKKNLMVYTNKSLTFIFMKLKMNKNKMVN